MLPSSAAAAGGEPITVLLHPLLRVSGDSVNSVLLVIVYRYDYY